MTEVKPALPKEREPQREHLSNMALAGQLGVKLAGDTVVTPSRWHPNVANTELTCPPQTCQSWVKFARTGFLPRKTARQAVLR